MILILKLISILVLASIIEFTSASPLSVLTGGRRDGKIVGGKEAIPHSHPYIVSIQVDQSQYCGGSIINENYIMTAAHCATREATDYTVVAGEHNLGLDEGGEQRVPVAAVIQHPKYNRIGSKNDIAVFRLTRPLVFNENVTAANIASSGFIPERTLTAIGWGDIEEDGGRSDTLQQVQVPFQTDDYCRRSYALVVDIDDETMICAGESGHDSCQGDSGGPLTSTDAEGKVTVVGVTSFGIGCARPRYPGVYTEVSFFSEWITKKTGLVSL